MGKKSSCAGLGVSGFASVNRAKGGIPKTGDKVDVPPKKVPYFKPGKELKDLINKEPDGTASAPPDAMAV